MRHGTPTQTPPASIALPGIVPAPLDGTLAASLERAARLAATVLDVPAAIIALLGDDRRCFVGGRTLPGWFSHDPGVLVRSGLSASIVESERAFSLDDVRESLDSDWGIAAVELGVRAVAGVPLRGHDGMPLGVLCALDSTARAWRNEELDLLTDLANTAATELDLRYRLAERERAERQLRHDALHDPLTGLKNRSCFMERLRHASERARRRADELFAVLFLDLDNFKVINDSLGHQAGDDLLTAVARRLEACTRGVDVVARLGGDEFALLLEYVADAGDAARVAERVQEALLAPVSLGGYDVFTSASIGVALGSSSNERPEYLLRSADMAMYRAKRGGRARYELFDRAMHADALRRLQVETELRRAIDRDEFVLHYQPIVSLATGRVSGVEALLRWRHPERGLVSPVEFVSVAEETGMILPLGRWALHEACRQLRTWHDAVSGEPPITVAVNLSVKQFAQPDLAEQVACALRVAGLDPGWLKLEITESVIVERTERATYALAELKALGVRVHMDDFGTGYSSLGYLHRLPLDAIKIDREFVSQMDSSDRALQLVRTILALVGSLGLEAVAEGVTTPGQLRLLRDLGCAYAQGFYFSEPVDADAIETLLRAAPAW